MINSKLKYKEQLESLGLTVECPCVEAEEKSIYAFRFCYSELNHPNTFIPQALKPVTGGAPPRKLTKEGLCDYYGLSLFMTEDQAREKFRKFDTKIKKRLGYTHISKGEIKPEAGLCSPPNQEGHFNLHEYTKVDLLPSFSLIGAL